MRPNGNLPLSLSASNWPSSNLAALIVLGVCCFLGGCSGGEDRPADASGTIDASDASDAADATSADAGDGSTADGSTADTEIGSDADAGAMMLVDHELWTPVGLSADPFGDAPDQIDCDPDAWGTEEIVPELTFFVRTQGCNYLTVSQPTLGAIAAGESVNIRFWHYTLTAPAASEAHLALQIGEHLMWEAYVPIPSDSGLLMDSWTAPEAIPAGEEIYFHVHNHGNNEYNLIEVSLSR